MRAPTIGTVACRRAHQDASRRRTTRRVRGRRRARPIAGSCGIESRQTRTAVMSPGPSVAAGAAAGGIDSLNTDRVPGTASSITRDRSGSIAAVAAATPDAMPPGGRGVLRCDRDRGLSFSFDGGPPSAISEHVGDIRAHAGPQHLARRLTAQHKWSRRQLHAGFVVERERPLSDQADPRARTQRPRGRDRSPSARRRPTRSADPRRSTRS